MVPTIPLQQRGMALHLEAVLQASAGQLARSSAEDAAGTVDRRRSKRRSLKLATSTNTPAAGEVAILIRDVSPVGMLIEADCDALNVGDRIEVALPDARSAIGRLVWKSGRYLGCQFDETVSSGAISAALLKAEPVRGAYPAEGLSSHAAAAVRHAVGPTINLSAALTLSLALWLLIGAAGYLVAR